MVSTRFRFTYIILPEAELAKRLAGDFPVRVVCVTKGADGCTVYSDDMARGYACEPVRVADTVGAGDAFSAAFLEHYCRTGDPFASAKRGNLLGAYVASQPGAVPEYDEHIKDRFTIALPAKAPDKIATVVALDIQGSPQIVKPDPYAEETRQERDARMRWWREAKFGMFIHWGVYAVPAGTWKGKQIPSIGEWIMNRGKIPCADYQTFAKQFNPVKYNADQWVRIAKDAGMKYIIITSKHHDGFALFDSKASNWNIVKATPYGQDLLEPLADACRKHGLKLGFYYSQAQDWNNGGSTAGGKWDKAQERDMDDYVEKVAVPQVKEILSHYGEFPAVLWWDTPTGMNRQRAEKLIALLKLKPGIIHNNRLGGGFKGDTETPEQHIPATGFPGRDWETCMTMNGTWGYKSYDQNWKSTENLLRNLIDIASKGGNYLLNVGPTAEGLIPQPSVDRLAEIGKWMKVNGDAIYGTAASPFKELFFNGRCTRKSGKLYLHVFAWPASGKILVPMTSPVAKAYLLTDPAKLLPVTSTGNGQAISLPAEAPDKIATVLVAEIAGDPEVIVPPVQPVAQAADGSLKLEAAEAILHGELKLETKHKNQNIGYWLNPADWVEWPIEITQPGKFAVTAEIAAQASGTFEVIVGDRKLVAKASKTGDYGKFQKARLGEIRIAAGRTTLVIRAVKEGWRPFNLTALTLAPAK
ncbi:MAG: PfkB family carbohydrate kinase [Thermoguttaceae bacterium]